MTQLILDVDDVALALPESKDGGYKCENKSLHTDTSMASGRLVRSLRGHFYNITYQYPYLNDTRRTQLLSAIEKGWEEPILCSFLPAGSNELLQSSFFVTEFSEPKFKWERILGDGARRALWGDFKLVLREVHPHD